MSKRNLLFSAALPFMSLALAPAALAQQAPPTNDQVVATPVAADEDEAATDDEIVVTGSRIKRPGLDTIRPIESISSELLDKRAFTNIADALNEVPIFGNGVNPNGGQNAFTVGQNFVDLFDLGTQRTLTLVNGRRFVSTNTPTSFGTVGGLQVDLNSIPVALLRSVEVVPLAGAAVYGSDAIAGTLNIILRDDFEGFEASGQYGLTQHGDGNLYQAQAAFGANFADGRGNVALAAEYSQQEGLLLNARPRLVNGDFNNVGFGNLRVDRDGDGIADNLVPTNRANPNCRASLSTGNPNFPLGPACPVGSDFNGDGFADTFNRQFANQTVQLFNNFGTVSPITSAFIPSLGSGRLADGNFYQFNSDGTLGTCTPGVTPGASSAFFAQGGTCGIDFFDSVTQIRSPVDRIVLTGIAHYDLANNVRFFTETTFANSSATELVSQGGFQSIAFSGTSGPLVLQTTNPFLTAQARDVLTRNGLTQFLYSRFNNDLVGAGQNSTENFTWRVASGFEGNFEVLGRGFDWDVSAVFGQSDVDTRTFGIIDGRFINALDSVSVNDALLDELISSGLVDTRAEALAALQNFSGTGVRNLQNGSIICQANVDFLTGNLSGANLPPAGSGIAQDDIIPPFIDGCVPLNPFVDGATQVDAVRFITGGPASTSAEIDQRVFTANLSGELLKLPAGWIRANVGFENRRERANFIPGLGTTIGITRSSPFLATGGLQQTREFYGEVAIPLVSRNWNIPFLTSFDVEGSARTVRTGTLDGVRVGAERDVQRATAWEVGGKLTTIPDISFRGSFTNSIRLPSLVELFSPTVQAFLTANDPCDARFSTGGRTPDIRQANCQAIGIDPQTFTSNVVNATLIGADTGNPNLLPERGRSFNAGVVIQPRFLERFAASFDLYNITIRDRIASLTLTQILNACFDSPDFPNDPICATTNFRRDSTGQVVFGQTGQLNAASSSYRAVQATFSYNFDVVDAYNALPFLGKVSADFGNLDFNVDILRALKNEFIIGRELPTDPIGTFLDPKWQGTFDTTYQLGDLRFFWRIAYQDSPVFNTLGSVSVLDNVTPVTPLPGPDFVSANIISNTQGARIINNFSVQYTLFGNSTIQFGMDNVFNHQPDQQELALGYFGIDEQLGRRFTFRLRTKF